MVKLKRLGQCKKGSVNRIIQIEGNGSLKKRLLEMGFIENTSIKTVKFAPLSDPIEFNIKGYNVSLRKKEADRILVKPE